MNGRGFGPGIVQNFVSALERREFVDLGIGELAPAGAVLRATLGSEALYVHDPVNKRISRISIPYGRVERQAATDKRNTGPFFLVYR